MEEQKNKLSQGRKLAVLGLSVFGVFVIVMWVIGFKNTVYGPFQYKTEIQAEQTGLCLSGNCGGNGQEELLNKDTDQDGLSDWEEFNVYDTSPYLEDSDSDGISDAEEIRRDLDPNCPQGSDCGTANALIRDVSEEETGDFLNSSDLETLNGLLGAQESGAGLDNVAAGQNNVGLEQALPGGANADELRQLLLEAGMDKAVLDQISDDVLMESYQETLQGNQ